MNSVALLAAAQTLAVLALLVLAVQALWFHYRSRRVLNENVRRRMIDAGPVSDDAIARVKLTALEQVLLRADIQIPRQKLVLVGILLMGFLAVVASLKGPLVVAITAGLLAVMLWMYWRFRFQQQRRRIYEELPGIIDSVLRYMSAGRSLENALVEAFRDAPPVFDPLNFRLRSAVESGRDYTGLFEDFAQLYQVPSLVLVSIALRTSARFGSSIKPVFKQVSESLRSQQELRREFMAATAEIRFTAAAFALLPLGLAGYMILINENYSDVLLNSTTGHWMLGVAGGLQALGMILIWRMIQGVGRD
ncbi:type II secretion system F family protein [Alloalcanivorax marinus]|uniref:type II secretion system F family protein n=1 Tax=Alloalcanivorax marinus TaxID=1177169 RepID=UPI0019320BF9|nr:type II secretion system F family protein [Alloalcanivorax marinus]MBL7252062.1 type II secretion system F family protein [Alloalcanivorax marinus]